eukprot:1160403-Pelagomonas_calceolata.AAC.4
MARHRISSLQQLYKHCLNASAFTPSFSIACRTASTTSWPFQEGPSSSSSSNSSSETGYIAAPHEGCGAAQRSTPGLERQAVRSLGCRETAGAGLPIN